MDLESELGSELESGMVTGMDMVVHNCYIHSALAYKRWRRNHTNQPCLSIRNSPTIDNSAQSTHERNTVISRNNYKC